MTADPNGQPSGPAHAAPTPDAHPLRRGSRWLAAVPRHVGRARTSTVVLSLLFLAIGALYLNVHPTAAETTSPTGGVVQPAPVAPTSGRARSTAPTAPSSTSAPATGTTSAAPTGTASQPATSAPATTPSSVAPAPSSTPGLPTVGSTTAAPTS